MGPSCKQITSGGSCRNNSSENKFIGSKPMGAASDISKPFTLSVTILTIQSGRWHWHGSLGFALGSVRLVPDCTMKAAPRGAATNSLLCWSFNDLGLVVLAFVGFLFLFHRWCCFFTSVILDTTHCCFKNQRSLCFHSLLRRCHEGKQTTS